MGMIVQPLRQFGIAGCVYDVRDLKISIDGVKAVIVG
jgi:hypothetical protein